MQANLWENDKISSTGMQTPGLSRPLPVPGIAALAVLRLIILAASRLFGAHTVLKEVVAGFGHAILIFALFSLFFRTGIELLLRRVPAETRSQTLCKTPASDVAQ